jgi:hypothetical protein
MWCGATDTPFKQQKLKAWQPILTPNWVIGTFAVVGLIFIPIGIILHTASEDVRAVNFPAEVSTTAANLSVLAMAAAGRGVLGAV